jgi:putative addiction module component (TIGR02574 family)
MAKGAKELEAQALTLDIEARAELAGRLLLSLDDPSGSEIEQLWLDEAARRLEDYRSGKTKGVAAEAVFEKALAELT